MSTGVEDASQPHQYKHYDDKHFLVEVNKQYRCICEMCSCGRHKCPRPKIKGEFETSYGSHYKNISIIPQPAQKQYRYEERHYNPSVLKTHYQEAYEGKSQIQTDISASRLENIGKSIVRPNIPFVGFTSYKDQYKPFKIQPMNLNPEFDELSKSRQKIADYMKKNPVKFQQYSSYKSAYQPPQLPKAEMGNHGIYKKNDVPFYGSSSYKNDYPEIKIEAIPIQQNQVKVGPYIKFQGSTSYNDHYHPYKIKIQDSSNRSCQVDHINIPSVNYNNKQHIYYDDKSKTFI